jgi:hypothetical protein
MPLRDRNDKIDIVRLSHFGHEAAIHQDFFNQVARLDLTQRLHQSVPQIRTSISPLKDAKSSSDLLNSGIVNAFGQLAMAIKSRDCHHERSLQTPFPFVNAFAVECGYNLPWKPMNILFDLYQQGRISDVRDTAQDAQSAARRAETQMQDLKRKVDSLTITCQALWELLAERLDMNENLILEKMQEIDLRDGTLDGRISPTLVSCPGCARTNKAERKQCLYCGADLPTTHIFGKV